MEIVRIPPNFIAGHTEFEDFLFRITYSNDLSLEAFSEILVTVRPGQITSSLADRISNTVSSIFPLLDS